MIPVLVVITVVVQHELIVLIFSKVITQPVVGLVRCVAENIPGVNKQVYVYVVGLWVGFGWVGFNYLFSGFGRGNGPLSL